MASASTRWPGRPRARGAALLVLPELCLCGYPTPEEASARAVAAGGEEIGRLGESARANGIALCFGFAERAADGRLYNSMACVTGDGAPLAVYRKVHLWKTEKAWAVPGSAFPASPWEPCGWGCGSATTPGFPRSPAASRWRASPSGSRARPGSAPRRSGSSHCARGRWTTASSWRAPPCREPSAGRRSTAPVSSWIRTAGCIARGREGRDEVICAEYDDAAVQSFRARLPLLDDLRPETYA